MPAHVQQLIASTLGIAAEQITPELEFNSIPEWDSLSHVNLMLTLETHLGTEIDADLMVTLTSVRAICEFATRNGRSSNGKRGAGIA